MRKPRKQSPRQVADDAAAAAFLPVVKQLVNQPVRPRPVPDNEPQVYVRGARVRKP